MNQNNDGPITMESHFMNAFATLPILNAVDELRLHLYLTPESVPVLMRLLATRFPSLHTLVLRFSFPDGTNLGSYPVDETIVFGSLTNLLIEDYYETTAYFTSLILNTTPKLDMFGIIFSEH